MYDCVKQKAIKIPIKYKILIYVTYSHFDVFFFGFA